MRETRERDSRERLSRDTLERDSRETLSRETRERDSRERLARDSVIDYLIVSESVLNSDILDAFEVNAPTLYTHHSQQRDSRERLARETKEYKWYNFDILTAPQAMPPAFLVHIHCTTVHVNGTDFKFWNLKSTS